MNFNLGNNMNKLIILVVVAVLLLLAINMYQEQMGKQCAVLASILVIVVCGYFAHTLLNNNENFVNNPNERNSPIVERFDDYGRDSYIENFEDHEVVAQQAAEQAAAEQAAVQQAAEQAATQQAAAAQQAATQQATQEQDLEPNAVPNSPPGLVGAIDDMNSNDLLPADSNNVHAKNNPLVPGDVNVNFNLTSTFFNGINTVGNSLRNASLDLRAEPPNPQGAGPCSFSNIGPDLSKKSLC
jgi:hypothetical protein